MAKLTSLCEEDDIAKVVLSVPVEDWKRFGTNTQICDWREAQMSEEPNKTEEAQN